MTIPRFKSIEWKNNGITLRGSALVTRSKNAPWFIFSHGFTGHRIGPGYLFVRLSRELAAANCSSLRFDFSGSGESDGAFQNMTVDTMKSDLISAAATVRKKFSPSHIVLIGFSLGGMIAALCAPAVKPAGLVLLSPVADPRGLIRRRKAIMDAGPNSSGYYENGPHEMALPFLDSLKTVDPVEVMSRRFRGRLLLIQGDRDASIPVAESGRYVHAARKAGIDTAYYILKNADHTYATVSHFKTVCSTVTSWVKERFL